MQAQPSIYDFRPQWRGPLLVSLGLHLGLASALLGYAAFHGGVGAGWGTISAGDAMSATLVSSAIPLPSTHAEQENVLANESKGISQTEPAKKQEEQEAIPIPDKAAKPVHQKLPPKPIQQKEKPVQTATNIVPFGQGGPVSGQYTLVKTAVGTGGLSVTGAGSFGSRYAWYVDTVRRKVSDNWFKQEIDPTITSASRVYLTFEIDRNGSPLNVKVSQSSGIPALDISATRALQRIDTFGPLPSDYAGSRVSVEFWFDYKR